MKKQLISLCLLLGATTSLHAENAYTSIPDLSGLQILTPTFAKRSSEKLRLENGVQVYLISDPESHESGAALAVEAGSWDDPKERLGLAHFTEHMLFLGTEKYPDISDYCRYLDAHGGKRNAFTASDRTVYIFSINNNALEGALDRFSQFFTAPLFDPQCISREVSAVDQEFRRDLLSEGWRDLHVKKELAHPDHPFHLFDIGNRDTLGTVTREELLDWYGSHYSADKMHLVLYGAQPLDELRSLVLTYFNAIPQRPLESSSISAPLFAESPTKNVLLVAPLHELQQLELTWEIPVAMIRDIEHRPGHIISYLLGHEGKGSLLSQLKKEGLAETIHTEYANLGRGQGAFTVSFELTEKGMENYQEVVTRTFQALKNFKKRGVPEYVFEEMEQSARLKYSFQPRQELFQLVSQYAYQMVDEPLATFPLKTLMATRFSPARIAHFLDLLSAEACQISLSQDSEAHPELTWKKEGWMHVPYALSPLADSVLQTWRGASVNSALAHVPPNPFLPRSIPTKNSKSTDTLLTLRPELYQESATGTLYFCEDFGLGGPKVAWQFLLHSTEIASVNPTSMVLASLLCHAVNEQLNEVSYNAQLAGLSFDLEANDKGLLLKLEGFQDNALTLLQEVVSALHHCTVSKDLFDAYVDGYRRQLSNSLCASPLREAMDLLNSMIYKEGIHRKEFLVALDQISYEEFKAFSKECLERCYLKGMLYGVENREVAEKAWEIFHNTLEFAAYPPELHSLPTLTDFEESMTPLYVVQQSALEGNALLLTADWGDFSFRKRASQEVLTKILEEPFFCELRTKQQTAYLVRNWSLEKQKHLYSFFAIQSHSHSPRDLLSRFELFFENTLQNLQGEVASETHFENVKKGLVTQLEHTATQPSEVCALLHQLAFDYEGAFDWLQKNVTALCELTYAEFLEDAKTALGRTNSKRLGIGIEGTLP